MDLWGHCTACERWFSMAADTRSCPVCRSEPSAVADRAETDPGAAPVAGQA